MHVKAKIQRWGNSLVLSISGAMKEIPNFSAGTTVDVEITNHSLLIKKPINSSKKTLPYSEAILLADITAENTHADTIAEVNSLSIPWV